MAHENQSPQILKQETSMDGPECVETARNCPRCWTIKMLMWTNRRGRHNSNHKTRGLGRHHPYESTPDLTLGIGVGGKASHGSSLQSNGKGLREGKIKNTPSSQS